MLIAGYYIKMQIDQGDAWVNAVDPRYEESTLHKECAWNCNMLKDINNNCEVVEFEKITYEQAQGQTCGYCEKPLDFEAVVCFSDSTK